MPLNFLNGSGDFTLEHAQRWPGVYFPLANEGGMMSSVTPLLSGDCKTGQNTFLLAPTSAETLHESRASRNFWVGIDGEPWSATGQSAPQQGARFTDREEDVVLTGGLLWQSVSRTHRASGLRSDVLSFVPAGKDRVEIMQVSLTNGGERPLTIAPAAAVPIYGRSADNIRDHRHVTSLLHRVELRPHGLDVTPTLTFDERGHQPGRVTYRVWGGDETGAPPAGFVPLSRDFVGQGSYDWPEAVVCSRPDAWLHAGQTAQGGEVTAALFFPTITLLPGQRCRYQIVLAVDDSPVPYLTPDGVSAALEDTKAWWQAQAGQTFRTGDPTFDAWMRWVAVQPLLRRIFGCSFLPHHDYGRGGRGWRDLWQDSLALLLTGPDRVRGDLLGYFAGVRTDGTNATIIGAKPGEFKADRNNIPRVWMDHGFWPLLTTALYLDETGDDRFLLEQQTYFSDHLPHRGEGTPRETPAPVRSGTVLEHLLTQLTTAFFDVGEHGHMRLRGADWNDGLDMASKHGESVAFTAAYAYGFDLLARSVEHLAETGEETLTVSAPLAALLDHPAEGYGDPAAMREALGRYCREIDRTGETVALPGRPLAERLRDMARWIREHIARTEWVGDGADLHWFNSYYDDDRRQVEGLRGKSVRMMLTGQVFAILSGTADEGRTREIIRAADWYLCDPGRGGYCLNTDFGEVKLDMGRMFGFAYGNKENGAVFCHMAVMYAYALYSRGLAEEGWRVLELLYRQSADFARGGILPGIPEYFDDRGQGMYPYLTGAASWLLLTLQTQAFGVRGQHGDLLLEPRLTAALFDESGAAEMTCTAAGRQVRVRYENPLRLDWGSYQIGTVQCGARSWEGRGASLLIVRAELPQIDEPLELTVTLIPKGEKIHV
ncbi:MAG: cellobiose phosphorylase [Clostridiales bacterium]|nr:cellobiose phosphorylase [Clostridiales bacterium]